MLEDDTASFEGTLSTTGEEQRICMNSTVANEGTRIKLKGYLVADVHRGKSKAQHCSHVLLEHEM